MHNSRRGVGATARRARHDTCGRMTWLGDGGVWYDGDDGERAMRLALEARARDAFAVDALALDARAEVMTD